MQEARLAEILRDRGWTVEPPEPTEPSPYPTFASVKAARAAFEAARQADLDAVTAKMIPHEDGTARVELGTSVWEFENETEARIRCAELNAALSDVHAKIQRRQPYPS